MSQETAQIRKVEDKTGTQFFPLTHIDAVIDENGDSASILLGRKQNTLVSGTNIKTINNQSVLGSGNLEVGSDIDTVSVSVDANTGTPSATGSVSGTTLSLSFHNLKGADGATGPQGGVGPAGPQGPQGLGFSSIATNQDGTMTITLTSGDTITVDLNHDHPVYPKYYLCEDEAEYNAMASHDSNTLYLIPEV